MRIPNAHVGDVVVSSLTIDDVFAFLPYNGKRLLEVLRGSGDERATCVRFDPAITPTTSSDVFRGRVPRWRCRATISLRARDTGEDVRAVVAWLGEGIGEASLEEMLIVGLGDADFAQVVAPTTWLTDAVREQASIVYAVVATLPDGQRLSAKSVRFDFGPYARDVPHGYKATVFRDGVASEEARIEVPFGSALVTTQLDGPRVEKEDTVRRSGPGWMETKLKFEGVVAIGREPLAAVLQGALGKIDWYKHARDEFQYTESMWDFKD